MAKNTKKKNFFTLLVVVLLAVVAIGGMLAYLTDRDSEVNVFTSGDVKIDLVEDYAQGSKLVPGIDIKKEAYIENTGTNDAYVWMTIAVPSGLDTVGNASKNVLHWNTPGAFWEGYHDKQTYIDSAIAAGYLPAGSTGVAKDATWNVNSAVDVQKNVAINGENYNVYTLLYNKVLVPGEKTNLGLSKVYLDGHVDCLDGKYYWIENGVATEIPYEGDLADAKVYVSAYAIQAENFDNVKAAYDAYQGQWGVNGTEYTPVIEFNAKSDLKTKAAEAIADGKKEIVLDAEGANIGDLNYGINKAMVPEGVTLNVVNAVVDGKSYGNAVDGTVVFTNCKFENPSGAYSIHFDSGNGKVIFNNCTLSGWCSFGNTISYVELNNCTIKGNGKYAMVRVYQDAVMNNCVIDCSNANMTDAYVDGISAIDGSVVSMTECTLKYLDLESSNNSKIVVDGNTIIETAVDEYVLKKNADR